MDAIILPEIGHYHSYVQLVAKAHMTWFAFHFAANTTALGYYQRHQVPFFRAFLLMGNIMGGLASACIAVYYCTANHHIKVLLQEVATAKEDVSADMLARLPSALPLPLFCLIAGALSFLCFAMAYGWHHAPRVAWPLNEPDSDDKRVSKE